LLHSAQSRGDFVAQFGCHGVECTVALDGSHRAVHRGRAAC
jgi:hypothetical protein